VFGLWLGGRLRVPVGLPVLGAMAQVPVRQGMLRVVTPALLAAARRLGREVHVWTIDDEQQMRSLLDAGVDGLVSDRPDVLRSVLRSRGAWV
jgi:glycerophosphoryl diester phosphodiesterase